MVLGARRGECMLVLLVAVMPVVWTGETRGGLQCKLNRDDRGLVVQVGAGRKATKTRLKALLVERVKFMEELLGGALPADLNVLFCDTARWGQRWSNRRF